MPNDEVMMRQSLLISLQNILDFPCTLSKWHWHSWIMVVLKQTKSHRDSYALNVL